MNDNNYIRNLNTDEVEDSRGAKKEVDIYKYKDVEGDMSTKNLDIGLWFVKRKIMFKKIFIIILIIISAISWSYSIYSFSYYVAVGMNEDQAIISEMVSSNLIGHDYLVQISAQNLSASSVSIFPLGNNKYDFMVELKNPNFRYWVNFKYCFYINSKNIACNNGFLMPGEKKPIIELAKEINSGVNNIGFSVDNLSWQRINLHKYPDWNNFENEHLNILVNDANFKSTTQSGLSDKLGYNSLDFTVVNKTPYNYWGVDFDILLKRGSKVISVNKYNITEFLSGEKRNIELSWPGKLNNISEVEILPIINILDQNNYIKYEGGSGLEK